MTYEEFVQQRYRALLRTANAICLERGLAEDLVHDVLIKAQRGWERIGRLDHPDAYVRRMLVNEHLSWRRKWSRIIPRAEVAADREEPDPAIAYAERAALGARIARLPRRQQIVLALRFYDDLSDPEIAAALALHSEHRARLHLAGAGDLADGGPGRIVRRAGCTAHDVLGREDRSWLTSPTTCAASTPTSPRIAPEKNGCGSGSNRVLLDRTRGHRSTE